MSTIRDRARDFWDRISPRERRLVVIGAIVAPITLALWLGLCDPRRPRCDGAAQQQDPQGARPSLDDMRARGQTHAAGDDVIATMGTEPLSLDTYLTNAAKKAQLRAEEHDHAAPAGDEERVRHELVVGDDRQDVDRAS